METSHTVDVLGMRASSTFEMTVTATDAASNVATGTVGFTTKALPANVPDIKVVTNDPSRTSPGLTLMTVVYWSGTGLAQIDDKNSLLLAVDAEGQVVWYYMTANPGTNTYPQVPTKLPNGHLVFLTGESGWAEIDMMGNVVQTHTAKEMGLDTLHHDIFPEPNGDYLGLSTQLRSVPGYSQGDAGPPATYNVVGDLIVEFGPDAGVIHRWSTFDMLDPLREGDPTMFGLPYWFRTYPTATATKDWTHCNTIYPDPSDGTIVVSSRTQGWVIKFAPNDGGAPQVQWKLGAGGDFTLTNPNETFQFGQHGVNRLPNGHLIMFDDGNERPQVDGGPTAPNSRAVEFSLDPAGKQATIVWQYGETPPFFSYFFGSAYVLPNGNVLLDDGGELTNQSALPVLSSNLKFARIMEVTHDATPTKVLELDIHDAMGSHPSDPTFSGYSVYRALRIPSLD
jgi:hypothetical protein